MIINNSDFLDYIWVSSLDSKQVALFVNMANSFVINYIWRDIMIDDYVDIIDGKWQTEYVLKNYPIVGNITITIIDKDWSETWYTDFIIDREKGIVYPWKPFARGFQNIRLEYSAWYSEAPSDLVLAWLIIASQYYNRRKANWIKSESVWWDRIERDTSSITGDVKGILDNYKTIYV